MRSRKGTGKYNGLRSREHGEVALSAMQTRARPNPLAFQGALDDLLEMIEAGYADEELRALAKRVERWR